MPLLPGDELPAGEVMMEHLDSDVSLIHQMFERLDKVESLIVTLADASHKTAIDVDNIQHRLDVLEQRLKPSYYASDRAGE